MNEFNIIIQAQQTFHDNRDVACLQFNVCNCVDVVNEFMQIIPKKGASTNSVDPDETPRFAASHQDLCYLPCQSTFLVTFDNIKFYNYESGPLSLR